MDIRVIKVNETGTLSVDIIENSLESLQQAVKGYIEMVYPFDDESVALICNEEGKLLGMEPTLKLVIGGKVVDVVCGPCLIVRSSYETGDIVSLTDEQVAYYMDFLANCMMWR